MKDQIESIKKILNRLYTMYPVQGEEISDCGIFYYVEEDFFCLTMHMSFHIVFDHNGGYKIEYWENADSEKVMKRLNTFLAVQEERWQLLQDDIKFDADSLNNQN
jgi:hypothetical protein